MVEEDLWAGQEHTMYNYEETVHPSETKVELEKTKDQLNIEIECLDKLENFPETIGYAREVKSR